MNKKLVETYVQLKAQEQALKEELATVRNEILKEDFTKVEMEGITVQKQSRKTYKRSGKIEELQKKHPNFVELKAKNLKTLYSVEPEGIERTITETLVVKGL